jgi:predicted TIM-barrel fold metal-dependent hydrolase
MNGHVTRRELLRTMAAAGAAALVPNVLSAGQTGRGASRRGRIDVHHHFLPPFQGNTFVRGWTPQASLDVMGKYGTESAILSLTQAADFLYDGTEKGRAFARRANEYAAKLVSDHPRQFGFFAALPLMEPDASLKEIEYAFDTLKCEGVSLFSNTGTKWPGDPLFEPAFAELNRRSSAIFFHPSVPQCCRNLVPGVNDAVIEFDFDTTRAITSMLYNGTLSRNPDMKVIVNHFGAAVPVLAGRIQDRVPGAGSNTPNVKQVGVNEKIPKGVFYEMAKLYYELAHASYPAPVAATMKIAPPSQYLFGSDYPLEAYETTVKPIPDLELPPDVQVAIDRSNAERLFPRFR